ncbi:U-box domain-containing protein 5-like isoform X1 [Syzygium oleosum]|uniref:U-box domain-containing protein 5-like isoform X1 n=1 Tax=Syzygium oleosum TaxID=219896 RepID=UPI0011D1B0A6|nr:U-box domain-containing protein 5-like isoform X1 [Syzygium oleosum]
MGSGVNEFVERSYPSSFKVHRALCAELMRIVNKVSSILPEIETARPRCSAGIQALCLLNRAIEKANLLLQHCSESSKLYLALTGDTIVARCERSRNMLEQSLGQLQNMVPVLLAIEISKLLDNLRSATFILEPSEDDAGKAVHDLIRQGPSESGSTENSELKALQFAASKLFITSPKSMLVERRSIKKLLDKVGESDPKKKKILLYLSSLLKKYGNSIVSGQTQSVRMENEGTYLTANSRHNSVYTEAAEVAETHLPGHREAQVDVSVDAILPEEFKCPLSLRLMYEPVVIASGQTFERTWIQKWFDEGNTFCPKTKKKLAHQLWTPNTALKGLISQWCTRHGLEIPDPIIQQGTVHPWDNSSTSIASLGSSLNDLRLQVDFSNVSLGSLGSSNNSESLLRRFANAFSPVTLHTKDTKQDHSYGSVDEEYFDIFSTLTELPWQSQCKVVEDFKSNLEYNHQSLHSASTENFLEALVRFLGKSRDLGDVKAQKTALQLLLTFLKNSRYEVMHVHQDGFSMLASFLDSEVAEQAFAIMEILSAQPDCRLKVANSGAIPSTLETLDCEIGDLYVSALKILHNLCLSTDLRPYVIPCIPKLVRFLKDGELAKYALLIIRNLCDIEEARISMTETHECIASVAELLETGSNEEQEHAVAIFLSLCSQRVQYCQLVLDEGFAVIPALVSISINGTERSKVCAMELLRLLRDANDSDGCYFSDLDPPTQGDPGCHCLETKPSSRMPGFFGRKLSIFSKKPVSAVPRKKK